MALVVAACVLGACGVGGTRSGVAVGPRLSAARLGSVRSALTFDGDWMGGIPQRDDLATDLELAARRGVEIVIDLRTEAAKTELSIVDPVTDVRMELVEIDPQRERTEAASDPWISAIAIDRVRAVLRTPGRPRVLILDETGTQSALVYAIHLAADEGETEVEALRAARATGLDDTHAAFVHAQVERILDSP